ncbi:MAG: protein phosphatase 2C domain-containing protein [Clostridiales bacterium]|nr:protein phosphatase 2C domain-containing protein [Clostridiales bacterium]
MDHYLYTNVGGHEPNCDHAQVIEHDDQVLIVVCDGLNGLPNGEQAAQIISEKALGAFLEGKAPAECCVIANSKFRELQFDNVELRRAGATICAVRIRDNRCEWANVGDSRIYHFSGGKLVHHSVDDTPTYRAFERGDFPYESIREQEGRTGMSVCIGQQETVEPHNDSFDLSSGDGIIVCTDGFWENVYETEMLIDIHKSFNAKDWAQKMILRAVQRSRLRGDNLTLVTYMKVAG